MSRLIRINPRDNVAVALQPLKAGEEALGVTLREDIPAGHKFALCDIAENENVVKYGFPIGHATQPISAGSWVHTHNVKTNLSGLLEYGYHPHPCAMPVDRKAAFEGYVREDGRVGIRNEVWIVNTVGCVNGTAKTLERMAQAAYGDAWTAFTASSTPTDAASSARITGTPRSCSPRWCAIRTRARCSC